MKRLIIQIVVIGFMVAIVRLVFFSILNLSYANITYDLFFRNSSISSIREAQSELEAGGDIANLKIIIHYIDSNNEVVAANACGTIRQLAEGHSAEYSPAITPLINRLKDSPPGVKREVVSALGAFGSLAAPAVPELVNQLRATGKNTDVGVLFARHYPRLAPRTLIQHIQP